MQLGNGPNHLTKKEAQSLIIMNPTSELPNPEQITQLPISKMLEKSMFSVDMVVLDTNVLHLMTYIPMTLKPMSGRSLKQ